jgi:hypothetical protein
MEEVHLDRSTIHLLPVIRGLPSEAANVRVAIESTQPSVLGLSIGPEELQSLRSFRGDPVGPDNFEEEVYVAGLSAWELPIKPPPCFSDAVHLADSRHLPVEAIDMDEVTYTESYVDCVSGLEVVFQGRLEKRLTKKRFRARTPRDFVLEWDAEVNGSPGFRRLQGRREAFMAGRLREIAASQPSVLAVVEVERARGVQVALETPEPRGRPNAPT